MRSFFGSILLILVLAALGATIYYHWSTNSHLEFELRNPDEPEKNDTGHQHGKTGGSPAGCSGRKNSCFPRGRNSRFPCRNAGTRGIVIPPVAAL